MNSVIWLFLSSNPIVAAYVVPKRGFATPTFHDASSLIARERNGSIIYGENATARTIYTVVSLVCMLILALVLGNA